MRPLVLLLALCAAARAASFAERFEDIKRTARPEELYAFLYALPKGGDLHHHGGGSNRAEWVHDVCTDPARNGGDEFYTRVRPGPAADGTPALLFQTIRRFAYERLAPGARADHVRLGDLSPEQRAAWLSALVLDRPDEGRQEFFGGLWPRKGDIERNPHVALELLAADIRALGAEHVRYVEAQFSADGFVDNDGNAIPAEEGVRLLKARLAQPDVAASGVTVRFQRSGLRYLPDAEARLEAAWNFAAAHGDLWVGLNLAGLEETPGGEPARFTARLRELRRTRPPLPLSLHAGEMDGRDSHVRDSLLLGASRIGHGVNLIKDPDTLLLLQQSRRVLVEINLISNRLLGYTPDLRTHPFPEYLRTGVPVCLNTDDRGVWDSNLTDEYYTAVTTYDLTWDEIVQLGRNSLAYSFAPPDVKARLLAEYEGAVAAFAAKYLPAGSLPLLAAEHPVAYGYARRTWSFSFSAARTSPAARNTSPAARPSSR
ncbi:MAG: adenosine deaminase [Opitutae bacterium]|nr:adenosine deaminase [Opitutae bacterium]